MQGGISGEISLGGEKSARTAELGTVYPVRTTASWKCLEILLWDLIVSDDVRELCFTIRQAKFSIYNTDLLCSVSNH